VISSSHEIFLKVAVSGAPFDAEERRAPESLHFNYQPTEQLKPSP
jgi:hypothetical protein